MKSVIALSLLLWLSMMLQQTHPNLFPSATLTLPVAVGCVFWLQSGLGIVVAAAALLISWMLQPTVLPVEIPIVLILAARNLTRTSTNFQSRPDMHRSWKTPALIVAAGLAAHSIAVANGSVPASVSALVDRLPVTVPATIVVVLTLQAAQEFGFVRYAAD